MANMAIQWFTRGVRAWSEGWWEIGRTTGDLLAPILGVRTGTISMHQNVTVAQAIVASCHRYDSARRRIVMSDLEFPSNMYLFEGFRRYGAEIVYVPSDDTVRTNLDRMLDAIDERGGAVIIDVPNGAAVADELIRRDVIVDYRPGAGIRMAPHFYNTSDEIDHAMDVLADIACPSATASRIPRPGSRVSDPATRLGS